MNIKEEIKKDVFKILKDVDIDSIIIEKPKDKTKGDYAIPCFTFSKVLRKSPIEIANYIKDNLDQKKYEKVEVVNGYLNIFVQKKVIVSYILNKIMTELNNYGSNNIGDSKNIVIEYSSPNIAKPFGIGHLRSTVIGEALKNIYEKNGYKVYSLDFLGDYGTQFGKVLYAYITWGDEEKVKQNPTKELKDLYVKFHEEAKLNPELDEQGRIWFRKLENNDPEALKLWNWFKEESLKDFKKTYKILGISDFDEYNGEAYYKEKAYDVIEMLKKKNLLEVSEGANVVNIGGWTYYQNTHMKGAPAWVCYFGVRYYCSIYEIDTNHYRLIVKEGDWLSKDCRVVLDYYLNSFENAKFVCEKYRYL